MERSPGAIIRWLFDSEHGPRNRLLPRWIFLRALGLIYFSAFYSLLFQIRGLIGPDGILPAGDYLEAVARSSAQARFWFAPSLLWISSSDHMLMAVCWIGHDRVAAAGGQRLAARHAGGLLRVLSFVRRGGAGFLRLPVRRHAAGGGIHLACSSRRRDSGRAWAREHPPSRASLFLLQWEWFRIYFESGVVKLASGDPQWRNFTAMDEYYQNGPLPTWIGWYVQHLPHWFHAFATGATLVMELGLVWMLFLPRRWRIVCFFIVTAWQIPVILTANYTFLNYLVLVLGFLLLDDRFICAFAAGSAGSSAVRRRAMLLSQATELRAAEPAAESAPHSRVRRTHSLRSSLALTSVMLLWIFYATTVQMIWMLLPRRAISTSPVAALDPFRIANRYGLFAVMTRGRYEIEFQGSNDGQNWTAYPFRYKPQALNKPPRHLRALSAALRLEPVVRVAGHVAREHHGAQHRGAAAGRRSAMCWPCSPAIRFRKRRPSRCARCCGNTGSRRWRRSAPPACGGGGNCWGFTRRCCN